MARFIGSLDDYEKYIGPRIRNTVNAFTKDERKNKQGICEFCKRKAELQAAHKHGKERKTLIQKALKKYDNGSYFDIDIEKCENEIIELHKPIDHVFYFLCTECHRKYDKNNKIVSNPEVNNISKKKITVSKQKAEHFNNEKKLSKKDAIDIINKELSLSINNYNTTYSNINEIKPEWWFEPSNDRFNNDFHLILNDHKNKKLYYFFIEGGTITEPQNIFYQKTNRDNKSQIYINVEDDNFQDKRSGFQFKRYLRKEISYT